MSAAYTLAQQYADGERDHDFLDAYVVELEAEIERLRCCGNCGLWSMSGWCTSEVTRYGTGRLNRCIWEPSRWRGGVDR